MARVDSTVEEAARQLLEFVWSLRVGSLHVRGADLRFDEDAAGDQALFIDLTLSDPPTDNETWPLDEVLELHRVIDVEAVRLGLAVPWHVTLRQESSEGLVPEDDDSSQ